MTLWEWFAEPFEYSFMWRGFLVAVLLGVSGGIVGTVMILRRMALMGDALAHSLLPGIGIAYLWFGPGTWSLFLGALAAGLFTAVGSSIASRLTRLKEEAAFAALFIVLFGLGVALLTHARGHIRFDLMTFLFGNVLAVSAEDLWLAAAVSSVTVCLLAVFYRDVLISSFDATFYRAVRRREMWIHAGIMAVIVLNLVAALKAMGIVLALGLFLLPAATASLWTVRWGSMLAMSSSIAVVGGVAGMLLSFHLGIACGPCIVMVLGAGLLLSVVFSPFGGMLANFRRPARHYAEDHDEFCHEHEHAADSAAS